MNFDRMRTLILDQAIRGKLVPQLMAESVVEQIGAVPEDVPFEIPNKWKWVPLNNLVLKHLGGGTPSKSNATFWNGEIPWASVKDLKGTVLSLTRDSITEEGLNNSSSNLIPAGTVIVCTRIGLGKIAINTVPMAINQDLRALFLSEKIDKSYFLYLYSGMRIEGAGTTVKGIKLSELLNLLIPLPPIEEQVRIVAKLDEAFAEIDRAEKAYEELQTLSGVLRGQILQEAIQGKLVPQLDSEEEVQQIGDAPEDVPFAIPEKWKWVQLKSVGTVIGGGTPKTSVSEYWGDDVSWITPADLGKNSSKWIQKGAKSITQKGLDESSAKLMPKGSVVYSSRAPIGHIAIAGQELCTNQGCKSFVPNEEVISTEWAYYMLIARTKDIQSRASGTTFKEISGKGVGETWITLPPLEEQKRIVAKIEDLLKQVDALSGK